MKNSGSANKKCVMLMIAMLGFISPVLAAYPAYHDSQPKFMKLLLAENPSSKEEISPKVLAAERAKQSPDDQILKVTELKVKGKLKYKVKLISPDGRVRTVLVDLQE